ncbi:rho guanine nucleotide exchange factor 11-like isoform X12 [Panulirus ornatus]|uniref:rho guanine nucleotide exchange factor 11-like isoform X12 n=1 Tax=Panulirus ornatus TaxID=150431 RepID=UPI003A8505AA
MDERLESIVEGNDSNDSSSGTLRTVVIHRGERGYGVTVSGESPVIVQDVKDGGPAAQAGVKKGDSIIEVNGTVVSKINHKEVVQIIKSTQSVKLTLRSCPEGDVSNLASPQDPSHRPLPPTPTPSKSNDRITAPLPVNTQLQNQMEVNKGKMLTKFLEKQWRVRDNIMVELQRGPSKVLQRNLEKELDSINRQISKIQEELKNMKDIDAQLHTHPRYSPRSPPLSRPSFSHPHSQSQHHSHSRSVSEVPPPLPARNRSLVTQTSAPNISTSSISLTSAPPLPPRLNQLERVGEGGLAQSLENIHKVQSLTHSVSSVSEPSSRPPSHYRNKSSPDPLGLQSSSSYMCGNDSVIDVSMTGSSGSRGKVSSVGSDDISVLEPPGTPPPPYAPGSVMHIYPSDEVDENYSTIIDDVISPTNTIGMCPTQPILSMEDEEFSDTELLEDHGPFQSLTKLFNHNAYLAVFMNYVISNCDSSSLFFYVITHLYKEGVGKDMKRWAYEITSSFLLPGAPLRLSNVEENVLHEIDETLQNELDKEEILRKVFWKARQRCREDLNEQLADFRNKRSAGLGSIFGPPDHSLEESMHNKTKELQIVENLLVPCLESVSDDLKNATDQMIVTASSLATILLKYYGVRSQQAHQLIDRCPLYVSKERPLRSKIFRGSKKQVYRDHHFNQHTYYSVTYCNHCGLIIWGIAPQGYQCTNCEMNIHKSCAKQVEEACIGQLHNKGRSRDIRFSSILGKIMPDDKDNRRKVSQVNAAQIERARKGFEEGNSDIFGLVSETDNLTGEKGNSSVGGSSGPSNKEQRRSDPGSVTGVGIANHNANATNAATTNNAQTASTTTSTSTPSGDLHNNAPDTLEELGALEVASSNVGSTEGAPTAKHSLQQPKKKSGTPVNRSESLKEKQHGRKRTRESRKHSDPNIPTSKSGDVDAESSHNFGTSGSSSNSSLSHSLESPSTSLEHVSRTDAPLPAPVLENDSDIEAEVDLPNWQKLVSEEEIKKLKPKERKRQETINELFHTERTHVRVLKVLKHLFQVPMTEAGLLPRDQLDILFPNMDQMLEIHTAFNQAMKKRRQEEPLVLRVGDLLINMFDGEQGDHFQQQAAEFLRTQFLALENLKQRQKRDQRLSSFLQEQENNPACRRLQLKDMLPAGFQRLSKYPLFMESLLAYTDSNTHPEEYEQISRALERAREILAYVNTAVQEAENSQRLSEIQRKLDQSSLAKNKHGHSDELKGNLDLTKHKLIYEGSLTWRIAKGQKNIDLLVLLLDEFIVLLQKADDKYILKNHSKSLGRDDNKLTHSPIVKYGPSMLFRAVATDNSAFFIVTTQSVGAQIYELVTSSPSERKVWFRHIQEAQEAYTARDGRNRRSHPQTPLQDLDDQPSPPPDGLRDVDDNEVDGADAAEGTIDISADTKIQQGASKSAEQIGKSEEPSSTPTTTPAAQPPASPETLAKKTEHLRRKDLKIRQALEEKQHIIADILNIPHEHFENVVDMAGEPAVGNKEPRELVLAAMFQAKCLQETLNEALNIREGDIVAARANNDSANKATSLPLYQAPMTKLMSISTALSQQLSSLLNLVSERDDERERMRKELVASRERLHLLHMRQNSVSNQTTSSTSPSHPVSATSGITPPSGTSPHTSRPSSFVSVASSTADHSDTPDHHDTDEDGSEVPKINSTHPEEFEDSKEDTVPETYEDAVCGSDPAEPKSVEVEGSSVGQESCEEGRGCEGSTETITT